MWKTRQLSMRWILPPRFLPGILLVIFVIPLLLTGCARLAAVSPTSTPAAPSTPTPKQSAVDLKLHTAVFIPSATPSATPDPLIRLSSERYVHPQGLFQLNPPDGWAIQSTDRAAVFTDPLSHGVLSVSALGVDSMLDPVSFKNLVFAREENAFSARQDYLEVGREENLSAGLVSITKSFVAYEKNWVVTTKYQQKGASVFTIDLWLEATQYPEKDMSIKNLFDSIDLCSDCSTEIALDTEPEITSQSFLFEHELVSMILPSIWLHDHSWSSYSTVDTFSSPDHCAVIQVLLFDDGGPVGTTVAGDMALELIGRFYGKDIRVRYDEFTNGREYLTWYSGKGEYYGKSVVETQDTSMLIITQMMENRCTQSYQDLLKTIWVNVQYQSQ